MKPPIGKIVLWVVTLVMMELAIIWALGVAPPDREQGDIQRIFYFHLGSIWPGFLAFFYVLYASIRYLISRELVWDRRALAAGEVGLTFSTIVLTTGPIWAKPTWGVWWSWDARLTSMLILWGLFLGYVKLRDYMDEDEKRARVSAVLGIIGALMVPFVYMSTRIYNTQHPAPVIGGSEGSGIKHPDMQIALILALCAFTVLFVVLWQRASEMYTTESELTRLRSRMMVLEDE